MTATTDVTSKDYARTVLSRLKEINGLITSTQLDHCDVRINSDGTMKFWLRKKMADGNYLAYDYTYDGNKMVDGERVIIDSEGYEVA